MCDTKRGLPRTLFPSAALILGVGLSALRLAGQANPVPLINQPLVPDAAAPGGQGFALTVNGTGFVSGATVNWNGSPRTTTLVSGSQLTASINAADIAAAGTACITVSNPSPGGGVSNTVFFPVATPIAGVQFTVSNTNTGDVEYGVAAGDLNGDGKLDLVVSNDFLNTVSVYLGNGDGTFQHSADYPAGDEPLSLVLADLNGDGKLDLAVTNLSSGSVSVFLGNGDGTFQPAAEFSAGNSPEGLFSADFNRDGKLDLAVANADPISAGTVSILLGNGDGTFQPPVAYSTAAYPLQVVSGDFNGDGTLDLAVTCATIGANVVSILLGNGDGTFQSHVDYAAGLDPGALLTADFSGDGRLDLAVADQSGGSLAVLLGNGDGTFQSPVTYGAGLAPSGLAVGDLDGAGALDLAVSLDANGAAAILLGNGNGTFQKQVHFATTEPLSAIATGDFNGDGRLDLVGASSDGFISVLLEDAAPGASLSKTSLAFATQLVNTTSRAQTDTLTDNGVQTLDIDSIAVSGDFLESNTCGPTLAVSASCTITVQFRPKVAGTLTGAVTITDNAPGSPQTVSLSGSGTFFSLSPTSLNFGDVDKGQTSPPQTVTLTNFAKTSESVSIKISGANSGEFAETSNCGTSLSPGASCAISVTFTAKYKGAASSSLQVSGGGGANLSVPLSGTGVSPGES